MPVVGGLARSAGRLLISQFVNQGLGANEIIRAIQKVGYGYRRQIMLDDIREVTGKGLSVKSTRLIGDTELFPRRGMSDVRLRRNARYRVHFELETFNKQTGEVTTGWTSMYSDSRRSKQEWAENFISQYEADTYEEGIGILSAKTVLVEHQAGWSF